MTAPTIYCEQLYPGLQVADIAEAIDFYTNKLGFTLRFTWGDPMDMAGVNLGKVSIHLFERKPVSAGSVYFEIDDADKLYGFHLANGVQVMAPPQDKLYSMRDYHVSDPYGNMLGFGHFIQHMGPPVPIERVDVPVRLEKRLAALLKELAEHKGMSVSSCLEETLLHSFETVGDGVASPHTSKTLQYIQELKQKHGIDYDTHASYRFVEE